MELGLVDLQVNGFQGVNFSADEFSEGEFANAFRGILATGTTAFLATVVTSPVEVYQRNLPVLSRLIRSSEFKNRVLGLHLEGPFISPEPGAVGNHRSDAVRNPDPVLLDRLQEWAEGEIKLLTIAAERCGAEELCRQATGLGITVSLGHQLATDKEIALLAAAGARCLTHLGNGVPATLPRLENPIWSGLAEDRLSAMIIADGHHLPASVLKVIIRAKGIPRTIVTSDASFLAKMCPGTYRDAGHRVVLEASGRIWNPEARCLAGSSAMMIDCMNHLASLGFLNFEDLLEIGFHNPLRLINRIPGSFEYVPTCKYEEEKGFLLLG
jgi:N-acetylglucosamine-6-phosphate deacetylase